MNREIIHGAKHVIEQEFNNSFGVLTERAKIYHLKHHFSMEL